jgi:RimJ/RimL family protein N-acetyltransferase
MIRQLTQEDAEAYVALRREALVDSPLSFARSPQDEPALSIEVARKRLGQTPGSVAIGAFGGGLVGIVGVIRDDRIKCAHKAHVCGMYVTAEHRRQGVGTQLLEAAIAHARTLPGVSCVQLSVTSEAEPARRLYERAGFRTWGTEPDALRHAGQAAACLYMTLELK